MCVILLTHGLVDESRIEVDVGVELSLDEERVAERDALELDGDLDQRLLAQDREHLLGNLADDLGAGIVVFVHAVA